MLPYRRREMKRKYKHEHDDYTVLAYTTCNVVTKKPIEVYSTVHLFRAIKMYIKFSREYPTATIVIKHNKYY